MQISLLVPGLTARGNRTDANGVLPITQAETEVLPRRARKGFSFGYPVAFFPSPGSAEVLLPGGGPAGGRALEGRDRSLTEPGRTTPVAGRWPSPDELSGGGRLVAFASEPLVRWHPDSVRSPTLLWAARVAICRRGFKRAW